MGVTEHRIHVGEQLFEQHDVLAEYYGSLSTSMLVLFQAISNGTDWRECMEPLVRFCSPWLGLMFIMYVVFTLFGMLNVITAVFVESAVQAAESDNKEQVVMDLLEIFPVDAAGKNTGI